MGNQNSNENFKFIVRQLFFTKYPNFKGANDFQLRLLSQPSDRSLQVGANIQEFRPSVVFWFNEDDDRQKEYEYLPDGAFYCIIPDQVNVYLIALLSVIMGDKDLFIKPQAQAPLPDWQLQYTLLFAPSFNVNIMGNFLQLEPKQFDNPQGADRVRANFLHVEVGRLLIPGFRF